MSTRSTKNILSLLFLMLIIYLCVAFYFIEQQSKPVTAVIGGIAWIQVLYWNFNDGFYPDGWGWGNWSIIEGCLEGQDLHGEPSVYFFPFSHGGDFVLETKIKFIRRSDVWDVEAQLLTRDSKEINYESGMVLFAGVNKVTIRHMANKINYIYKTFSINMSINYGEWYVMRFMIYNGTIKAFVNDTLVFVSNGRYPVGEYSEPHLAVIYGTARFEYVKIYKNTPESLLLQQEDEWRR